MPGRKRATPLRAVIAALAIGCAATVGACGASGRSGNSSHSGPYAAGLKFSDCMRAHGVSSFPDPGGGGGGVNLAGTGINPQSPAFKSANAACARLAPGGGRGGVRATESQFLAAIGFAKCMRVHGFPDFPDPTHVDAPPGPILIVGHGLFFRVGASFDPNAPAASRALAACSR